MFFVYDVIYDRVYIFGFDCCVKVWRVELLGVLMSLLGEWKYEGNVNFVIVFKYSFGMVVIVVDVVVGVVRVYKINEEDIFGSFFGRFYCFCVMDERGNLVLMEKWVYYLVIM